MTTVFAYRAVFEKTYDDVRSQTDDGGAFGGFEDDEEEEKKEEKEDSDALAGAEKEGLDEEV